jgi:hypothetical protein
MPPYASTQITQYIPKYDWVGSNYECLKQHKKYWRQAEIPNGPER